MIKGLLGVTPHTRGEVTIWFRGYGDSMDVEVNCQSQELVLFTLLLVVLRYKQASVYCLEDFFPFHDLLFDFYC